MTSAVLGDAVNYAIGNKLGEPPCLGLGSRQAAACPQARGSAWGQPALALLLAGGQRCWQPGAHGRAARWLMLPCRLPCRMPARPVGAGQAAAEAAVHCADREVLREVRREDGRAGALRAHRAHLCAVCGRYRQHGVQQVSCCGGGRGWLGCAAPSVPVPLAAADVRSRQPLSCGLVSPPCPRTPRWCQAAA